MKKYLVLVALLVILLIAPACRGSKKTIYDDAIIYECQTYNKTVKGTTLNILEMSTDELGNPNSGFKYFRLLFYSNHTFARVTYPYATQIEEIFYGTYTQKNEPTDVPKVDANGATVVDEDGNIVYVTKSIITLYYDDPIGSGSMDNVTGYERYEVTDGTNKLTRKQSQITLDYQAYIYQIWKRVEKKDLIK